MTKILLIRHGQSQANLLGVFAGHYDPALTESGMAQAEATADYIARNYKIDKIYASDLKRAYDTAACLGRLLQMEVVKEPNLREIHAGKWENVGFSDIQARYPEAYDTWLRDIGNAVCVDGESVLQLGQRVMGALEQIVKENPGKTVAIGTHATPIRVFMSLVQTGGLTEMANVPWVSNASVTIAAYDNGQWQITDASLDAHLDRLRTTLPNNV